MFTRLYEAAIRAERRRILRRRKRNPPIPNLTVLQQSLMTQLRGEHKHTLKVMDADKNLGQAITTTEFATKQTIEEHLSGNVYRRLTEQLARANQRGFEMKMESFTNRVAPHVSDADELTFLRRGLKTRRGNMSRFYTLAKVHKFPLQLRPIVATCGTAQSALSQWLDYILQQLIPYVGIHIKDVKPDVLC